MLELWGNTSDDGASETPVHTLQDGERVVKMVRSQWRWLVQCLCCCSACVHMVETSWCGCQSLPSWLWSVSTSDLLNTCEKHTLNRSKPLSPFKYGSHAAIFSPLEKWSQNLASVGADSLEQHWWGVKWKLRVIESPETLTRWDFPPWKKPGSENPAGSSLVNYDFCQLKKIEMINLLCWGFFSHY